MVGLRRRQRQICQSGLVAAVDRQARPPELPNFIHGGSPRNPMGVARAYARPRSGGHPRTTAKMRASIGSAASYGCIRMLNEDVADLYDRVSVGSPVMMVP